MPVGEDMGRIYVVGTADTKGEELAFITRTLQDQGRDAVLVDVGIRAPSVPPDIGAQEIAQFGTSERIFTTDRGTAVAAMAEAFARFLPTRTDLAGVIGLGGGGGTSIVTAGMRELPIGIPKLMVSTLASGDVAPYVGVSDIMMMPAVTDLAGLNRINRVVLTHAANAILAMSENPIPVDQSRPAVGLTMFGVTTPAVTEIVRLLSDSVEPIVFHATGTGGRTMERLVDSRLLSGVIDLTTTEICDLLFGGVLPAGPDRLDSIIRTGVPYVGSVGACDMINFWAPETVPHRFAERQFYRHNSNVTLMRTTAEECHRVGEWIGSKLDQFAGPLRFLIPERGVSALDSLGSPFFDPVADAALFDAIESSVHWTGNRKLQRLPLHINDPAFAAAAVAAWREIAGEDR